MRTVLRALLVTIGLVLAAGLVLHLAGWAWADRLITGSLVALVAIPIANVGMVLVSEISRRHWGFVAAAVVVAAELLYVVAR